MINQNHLIFLSFGKRGDTGGGDYLGEHWIKGLRDSYELFQICYDCETENAWQFFGKICV